MIRKALIKSLFLLLFVTLSMSSMAWWGQTGHRIVGEIADKYLKAKTRKAIREILGDESIAIASNWADFIKSDSNYNYLNPWHYVNLPGRLSHEEVRRMLEPDTGINLYSKLNFVIRELKNKQLEKEKKVLYLKLLIHFVGDLHQPMHVGGRAEDLGGNRVRVLWFSDTTNLHSVWDERLIGHQDLSYTEYTAAIDHATKQQRAAWQSQPMIEWFLESYDIAQKIYSGITRPFQRLSYRYSFEYIDIVNKRLLMGGVRLAGLLNEIFG